MEGSLQEKSITALTVEEALESHRQTEVFSLQLTEISLSFIVSFIPNHK